MMASLRDLLLLVSCCCLLGQRCLAKTAAPCQHSNWNNGFKTFVKRHIPPGTPDNTDADQWREYIKQHSCERPTQSFLPTSDLEKVKAVCTIQGGKVYKGNLCISKQPFRFITVRSQNGTCVIKNVTVENKYLILACEDNQDNQCLPVHFEGNPQDIKPDNKAKDCQDPLKDKATCLNMTGLCLLSVVLLSYFDY